MRKIKQLGNQNVQGKPKPVLITELLVMKEFIKLKMKILRL